MKLLPDYLCVGVLTLVAGWVNCGRHGVRIRRVCCGLACCSGGLIVADWTTVLSDGGNGILDMAALAACCMRP